MAQVPKIISPQVDVGAAPSARFEAPQFTNYSAQNTAKAGDGLQQLGGQLGNIAADMAEKANAARLDDAANQAQNFAMDLKFNKESGYLNIKGEAALNRKDAPALDEDYTARLKKQIDDIHDNLGNDAQKMAFKRFSGNLLTQFRGGVMEHMTSQQNVYMGSVAQATQETASREIALSWGDPKGLEAAAQRLQSAALQEAQLTGKSPEWAAEKARQGMSRGHSLAISAALERGDYLGASGYLDKYANQMQADDILKTRAVIDKHGSQITVTSAVDKAYNENGAAFADSDTNRALNILWGAESNFRQFDKSGGVITSEKGAKGISQVLPTTGPEAAKLAGEKWNEELFYRKMTGDPAKDKEAIDYNKKLGAAYFNKQLQDFGGRVDMAFAAYNAGPGALKNAVKRAEKDGGTYLDYLPKETQGYVQKNVAQFTAGKGGGMPTQKQMDDSVLSALGPNATEVQKQDAIDQSRLRYKQLVASSAEREFQGVNAAISALQQNGGNFASLPVSVRDNIPFGKVDQVRSYADKLASGKLSTNTAVYDKLSDRTFLSQLSDAEFNTLRTDLETKDFQQFSAERQAIKTGKALNAAGDIPRESINSALSDRLNSLGIDPSPKKGDEAEQMRIGAIKRFVANEVLEQQAGLGRKLNDKEIRSLVDNLFLRSFRFKDTVLGIQYGDSKQGSIKSVKYDNIPENERKKIEDSFKMRGVQNPSNGDVLGVYLKMQVAKND